MKAENRNRINYSFVKILTGSDLSKRRIPYMSIVSPYKGAAIWLTACMHGDEIGGTVIIQELFKRLRNRLLCGSIHAFPLLNPFGFEVVSRSIALTKEDLNRSFPGNEKGTLAQRIADRIFSFIMATRPNLVLDLHNDWNKSIPYVLIDPIEHNELKKNIQQLAFASGLLIIEDSDEIRTSLTYNLLQRKVNALTLELGESYVINENNIEIGIRAILNILVQMKMVETTDQQFFYSLPEDIRGKILYYSAKPLSSTSGIIRFLKKPGDPFSKGQKVAKIFNAFGKLVETIQAEENGIIIGLTDNAISFPGTPVMASAVVR
ncbi:MAG: succinylglutamate desuccinylase/aspartoacylase family protein [Bacteroidales bacterium]